MRRALLLMLAACSASSPTYITIGADAVATARAVTAADGHAAAVIETLGDHVVLAVDPRELEHISEAMHAAFGRCGGFMVHDSLADAEAPPKPERPPLSYTIDHSEDVRTVVATLDRTRIAGTIRSLSSMPNRYFQSKTGAEASLWLRELWRGYAHDRPEITVELFDQGYAQKSVILTIPGSSRAQEVIVLGGHLDSIAPGGTSSKAPGADDDASGIATLNETLRQLLAHDYRPARTVKFIAYAAEEVGLRGSLAIVRDFGKRKINVVGALQLDMTNYKGSDKDIWLMRDFTSAAQNEFLGRLIDTYVGASWGYDACGYACSDHAAWHRAGVPASMPFEARMRDRNMKIHSRDDTLETSDTNATHALAFAKLATAYAIELGKGELGGQLAVSR